VPGRIAERRDRMTAARIGHERVEGRPDQQTEGERRPAEHRANLSSTLGYLAGVHPNCVAVDAVLASAGLAGRVQILDDAAPTAAAAAAQLGVAVAAIANSLIFATAEDEPLLVMTSGAHRVDTGKVAALVGSAELRRADADFVYRHTGQRIGGVAPVAHPAPIRTLVDVTLAGYPKVWAAGGIPHAVFPTTFDELVRITAGEPAAVA
jgi:prolyl-tRNA editing enzyme YbaK/EbsC (Cys-tRNA(Pro) deacylase)